MQYADNPQDSNFVLDLMFLHPTSEELNNQIILPYLWGPSDHALLSVYIMIEEELIQEKKPAIIKNNIKEKEFINGLISRVGNIDTSNIYSWETLEEIANKFASIVKELWNEDAR